MFIFKQMTFYGELMYNELISKVYFLCKLKGTIGLVLSTKNLKIFIVTTMVDLVGCLK